MSNGSIYDYSLVIIAFSASLRMLLHCCAPHVRQSAACRHQNTHTSSAALEIATSYTTHLPPPFTFQHKNNKQQAACVQQSIIKARDSNKFFRFHPYTHSHTHTHIEPACQAGRLAVRQSTLSAVSSQL